METVSRTVVQNGASIGANATILPGITIGAGAMVGAGSVVTRDVPELAIVMGNPARISGYVDTLMVSDEQYSQKNLESAELAETVSPYLFRLKTASDLRGSLVAGEIDKDIPFAPKRFFLVHDVPSIESRGSHAHKKCHQFLVCVAGQVRAIVDDGSKKFEFSLDSPDLGVYMPPMTWGTQYKYSKDAVLLVLASDAYDASDYIRSYSDFLTLKKSGV
jgi:hypothetical protein